MMKSVIYMTAAALTVGTMLWTAPMAVYAGEINKAVLISETLEIEETTTVVEDTEETDPVVQAGETRTAQVKAPEGVAETVRVESAVESKTETTGETDDETADEEDSAAVVEEDEASEHTEAVASEFEATAAVSAANVRQNVVNYALQFLGGKYRDGGNDPHSGVDCSGFVRYVMQNGAGISMNRSSVSQATQGRSISSSEMQPGDLVFYGEGSRINHVGMYIGNGQIVHASTYKTGIKISKWNYRDPIKIISMFG